MDRELAINLAELSAAIEHRKFDQSVAELAHLALQHGCTLAELAEICDRRVGLHVTEEGIKLHAEIRYNSNGTRIKGTALPNSLGIKAIGVPVKNSRVRGQKARKAIRAKIAIQQENYKVDAKRKFELVAEKFRRGGIVWNSTKGRIPKRRLRSALHRAELAAANGYYIIAIAELRGDRT